MTNLERLRALAEVDPPPIPIPGYGQYVGKRRKSGERKRLHQRTPIPVPTDNSVPRWNSSTPIQQAPFKPGQTARTRKLKRRTRPTPGSVEGRRQPTLD